MLFFHFRAVVRRALLIPLARSFSRARATAQAADAPGTTPSSANRRRDDPLYDPFTAERVTSPPAPLETKAVCRGGVWHVFSGRGIDVEHEKKVDLGVWGDADCHGLVAEAPFTMVGGVDVKSTSSSR